MIPAAVVRLLYLASAILFIIGLKRLQHPASARAGNAISGLGMLLAIVTTVVTFRILSPAQLLAGVLVGSALGYWMATAVRMTAMPQMVALLNGFGGAASLLVALAELLRARATASQLPLDSGVAIELSILIGGVTFTGSLVAWAKLQEVMSGRPITYPAQQWVNAALFLVALALGAWQVLLPPAHTAPAFAVTAASLLLGVLLVIPIGGADMPVVISLLNSYSGIAGAMTGFVIHNDVLIVAGALVGSSGIILSQIMCRAMNRSLTNVLFGAFGSTATSTRSNAGMSVRSVSPEDAAIQLAYATTVIVVPGYGMAVAQAQHQVRELGELIEKRGGEVLYAIHPVAGRMPGHMNVLLAEANVPYDKLHALEDVNSEFVRCDVAVVIGANDVVNPAARSDPSSPIYGMPILDVDRAKSCIVLKRSMAAGFAGIENELFYAPRTAMLFGDARQSLTRIISEIKQL